VALLLSVLLYSGLAAVVFGGIAIVWPLRWSRRSAQGSRARRRRALAVVCVGLASCAAALLWPTPVIRAAGVSSAIDEIMPAYQFIEHHETIVRASPAAVFAAIRPVTASDIRFFRLLTWIRNPRIRSSRETILAAPAEKPLLEVALRSGFTLVKEIPDREMVIRIRVAPSVTGVMNFLVRDEGDGRSRLTTETRVFADTERSLRGFTAYWRVIYPGSSLIRVEWLRAIKRRAEIQSSSDD